MLAKASDGRSCVCVTVSRSYCLRIALPRGRCHGPCRGRSFRPWLDLQMRNFSQHNRQARLHEAQMVTAEVLHAKALSDAMLRWETRGPGDTDNALRRVARRHGIDYGALWSLRYRAPKRIWADVANAIATAYEAERQNQIRKLEHAAELTEAVAGAHCPSVAKARAVLRQAKGETDALVDAKRERLANRGRA